jgi:hypothetical protein
MCRVWLASNHKGIPHIKVTYYKNILRCVPLPICVVHNLFWRHRNLNMWSIYSTNSTFKMRQKWSSPTFACSVLNEGSFDLIWSFASFRKQNNTSINFMWIVHVDLKNRFSAWENDWGPPTMYKNMARDSIEEILLVDFKSYVETSKSCSDQNISILIPNIL